MKEGVTINIGNFESIRLDTSEHDDEFAMLNDLWDHLNLWKEYSPTAIKMIETIKKRLEEITQ